MRGNVFTECSDQKCVYDFGLVVRNTKVEAFVKRQQVASSASVRKFHRRHQFPSSFWTRRLQSFGMNRQKLVAILVADCRAAVLRVGKSQIYFGCSRAMAVVTLKLNVGPVRASANRLHVESMI